MGRMRLPHARGGEPAKATAKPPQPTVFPTHVGVNRLLLAGQLAAQRLPHARGGEPRRMSPDAPSWRSSPRTWG